VAYYQDYFRAEVRGTRRLTPNMVRVTFGGGDLHRFTSSDAGDERLIVVFPPAGASEPPPPVTMPDGTLDYPDRATCPPMRSYTVRSWDPDAHEMVIDFVAHDGGVASPWALGAMPGSVVYLTVAAGWYAPPAEARWQVLLADMTGLPALGRIVEDAGHGLPTIAVAEVIESADRQELELPAGCRVHWIVGSGNGRGPSRLMNALRRLELPEGPGYVWYAGEAAESRAVRKFLRQDLGWSNDAFTILGYWRVKQEEWLRRYEEVAEQLETVYTEAVSHGKSEGDALEIYDTALEKAGL
jgi:NADPH-dependent ferric siderophore reductase